MSLKKYIVDAIKGKEVIDLASEIVRIPSITGREGKEVPQLLADYLSSAGFNPELRRINNNRFNVFCEMKYKQKGPKLLFEGHYDTVPFEKSNKKSVKGQVVDGRLYGRGSADMKSAIAGMVVVMKVLNDLRIPMKGTLVFVSEGGEESDGAGLQLMMSDGSLDCDFAIIGEPTGLQINIGNRGSWINTIKTLGVATHSGVAQQGVNAIEKMSKGIIV